ncbi:DNA helicase IV [Ruaniaceae bacterium KH17]|nr:DNA helicase IV [Ruaniaceae bacterium KH17]
MVSDRVSREIANEQGIVDRIYARLDLLRENYRTSLAGVRREGPSGSPQNRSERDAFASHYEDMVARLDQVENRLIFGRLDLQDGGTLYVGRIGILDENHDQLLVDWRAPIARPFYQATAAYPGDVIRRRHITTSGRVVTAVEDELLAHGEIPEEMVVTGGGALYAALAADRTGQMGDIVATIQREQDQIIRSDVEGILVVQGGPGTGKTAVALHRAAYLLYAHRERLQRSGVLLVGPSRVFLDYIDQVLPSLGENDVVATTIGDLLPGTRASARESEAVAEIKGDLKMSDAMERAVQALQRVPDGVEKVEVDGVTLEIRPETLRAAMGRAHRAASTHNEGRTPFVLAMLEDLVRQYAEQTGRDEPDSYMYEDVRTNRDVRIALNLAWMPTAPHTLLERLYARPDLLEASAPHLTRTERELLYREKGSEWTISDVPLLDELAELLGPHEEAEARRTRVAAKAAQRAAVDLAQQAIDSQDLGGGMLDAETLAARFSQSGPRLTLAERAAGDRTWTYGHIVIDEAQELSPMAWRSLLRRCPLRSMTVVGDLAQRSSSEPATSWRSVMGKAGREHVRQAALTVSYRTPKTVLDAASAVLMAGAPGDYLPLTAARDIPDSLETTRGHWRDVLVDIVRSELGGKTAVIAPAEQLAGVRDELWQYLREEMTAPGGKALMAPLVAIDVAAAKGLEFDSVILVEPAQIAAASVGDIYVAMTRPTKRLHAIYQYELPDGWPNSGH